jgi:hypothetical protein
MMPSWRRRYQLPSIALDLRVRLVTFENRGQQHSHLQSGDNLRVL